jgi:sugar-specific transcriptional regulator TrmB
MDLSAFRRIGMTEGELRTYEALLSLGSSTAGPLARRAKVSPSKLYDVMDRLVAKGLAGSVVKNGVKVFSPSDPRMILDLVGKREEELASAKRALQAELPALLAARAAFAPGKVAEIYEGFHAYQMIMEELIGQLSKPDELLVLGAPRLANEKWEPYLWKFHQRREKRGVGMRIIYNSDAREYGEKRKTLKRTQVRYLPSDIVQPNWVEVFNDAVLLAFIVEEPVAIVIRQPSIAKSFRYYFEMMWRISHP